MAEPVWRQILEGTYDPFASSFNTQRSSGGMGGLEVDWRKFSASQDERRAQERARAEADRAALEAQGDEYVNLQNAQGRLERALGTAEALGQPGVEPDEPPTALEGVARVLDTAKSVVVGGLSGLLGWDIEGEQPGDSTRTLGGRFRRQEDLIGNRSRIGAAWDRAMNALFYNRSYGFGDFGPLRYEADETSRGARVALGTAAFILDTVFDPLTYYSFGSSIVGRLMASTGVRVATRSAGREALKGAGEAVMKAEAGKIYRGELAARVARVTGEDMSELAIRDNATLVETLFRTNKELFEETALDGWSMGNAAAYGARGRTGLFDRLVGTVGEDSARKIFDDLPGDLAGGSRFRVPFRRTVSPETGLRMPTIIRFPFSQPGRGFDVLGMGTVTRKMNEARLWARTGPAKFIEHVSGRYGQNWTKVLNAARQGDAEAVEAYSIFFSRMVFEKADREFVRRFDHGVNMTMQAVTRMLKLDEVTDPQEALEWVAEAYFKRGRDDLPEISTPNHIIASDITDQFHAATDRTLEIAKEIYGEDHVRKLEDYATRMLTDEGFAEVEARYGLISKRGGRVVEGGTGRQYTSFPKKMHVDENGRIVVDEWYTPQEIKEKFNRDLFIDDPVVAIGMYLEMMRRELKRDWALKTMQEMGILLPVGQDVITRPTFGRISSEAAQRVTRLRQIIGRVERGEPVEPADAARIRAFQTAQAEMSRVGELQEVEPGIFRSRDGLVEIRQSSQGKWLAYVNGEPIQRPLAPSQRPLELETEPVAPRPEEPQPAGEPQIDATWDPKRFGYYDSDGNRVPVTSVRARQQTILGISRAGEGAYLGLPEFRPWLENPTEEKLEYVHKMLRARLHAHKLEPSLSAADYNRYVEQIMDLEESFPWLKNMDYGDVAPKFVPPPPKKHVPLIPKYMFTVEGEIVDNPEYLASLGRAVEPEAPVAPRSVEGVELPPGPRIEEEILQELEGAPLSWSKSGRNTVSKYKDFEIVISPVKKEPGRMARYRIEVVAPDGVRSSDTSNVNLEYTKGLVSKFHLRPAIRDYELRVRERAIREAIGDSGEWPGLSLVEDSFVDYGNGLTELAEVNFGDGSSLMLSWNGRSWVSSRLIHGAHTGEQPVAFANDNWDEFSQALDEVYPGIKRILDEQLPGRPVESPDGTISFAEGPAPARAGVAAAAPAPGQSVRDYEYAAGLARAEEQMSFSVDDFGEEGGIVIQAAVQGETRLFTGELRRVGRSAYQLSVSENVRTIRTAFFEGNKQRAIDDAQRQIRGAYADVYREEAIAARYGVEQSGPRAFVVEDLDDLLRTGFNDIRTVPGGEGKYRFSMKADGTIDVDYDSLGDGGWEGVADNVATREEARDIAMRHSSDLFGPMPDAARAVEPAAPSAPEISRNIQKTAFGSSNPGARNINEGGLSIRGPEVRVEVDADGVFEPYEYLGNVYTVRPRDNGYDIIVTRNGEEFKVFEGFGNADPDAVKRAIQRDVDRYYSMEVANASPGFGVRRGPKEEHSYLSVSNFVKDDETGDLVARSGWYEIRIKDDGSGAFGVEIYDRRIINRMKGQESRWRGPDTEYDAQLFIPGAIPRQSSIQDAIDQAMDQLAWLDRNIMMPPEPGSGSLFYDGFWYRVIYTQGDPDEIVPEDGVAQKVFRVSVQDPSGQNTRLVSDRTHLTLEQYEMVIYNHMLEVWEETTGARLMTPYYYFPGEGNRLRTVTRVPNPNDPSDPPMVSQYYLQTAPEQAAVRDSGFTVEATPAGDDAYSITITDKNGMVSNNFEASLRKTTAESGAEIWLLEVFQKSFFAGKRRPATIDVRYPIYASPVHPEDLQRAGSFGVAKLVDDILSLNQTHIFDIDSAIEDVGDLPLPIYSNIFGNFKPVVIPGEGNTWYRLVGQRGNFKIQSGSMGPRDAASELPETFATVEEAVDWIIRRVASLRDGLTKFADETDSNIRRLFNAQLNTPVRIGSYEFESVIERVEQRYIPGKFGGRGGRNVNERIVGVYVTVNGNRRLVEEVPFEDSNNAMVRAYEQVLEQAARRAEEEAARTAAASGVAAAPKAPRPQVETQADPARPKRNPPSSASLQQAFRSVVPDPERYPTEYRPFNTATQPRRASWFYEGVGYVIERAERSIIRPQPGAAGRVQVDTYNIYRVNEGRPRTTVTSGVSYDEAINATLRDANEVFIQRNPAQRAEALKIPPPEKTGSRQVGPGEYEYTLPDGTVMRVVRVRREVTKGKEIWAVQDSSGNVIGRFRTKDDAMNALSGKPVRPIFEHPEGDRMGLLAREAIKAIEQAEKKIQKITTDALAGKGTVADLESVQEEIDQAVNVLRNALEVLSFDDPDTARRIVTEINGRPDVQQILSDKIEGVASVRPEAPARAGVQGSLGEGTEVMPEIGFNDRYQAEFYANMRANKTRTPAARIVEDQVWETNREELLDKLAQDVKWLEAAFDFDFWTRMPGEAIDTWVDRVMTFVGRIERETGGKPFSPERELTDRTRYVEALREAGYAPVTTAQGVRMNDTVVRIMEREKLYGPDLLNDIIRKHFRAAPDEDGPERFFRDFWRPYYTASKAWMTQGRGYGYTVRNIIGSMYNSWLLDVNERHFRQSAALLAARIGAKEDADAAIVRIGAGQAGDIVQVWDDTFYASLEKRIRDGQIRIKRDDAKAIVTAYKSFVENNYGGRSATSRTQGEILDRGSYGEGIFGTKELGRTPADLYPGRAVEDLSWWQRGLNASVDNAWMRHVTRLNEGVEDYLRFAAFLRGIDMYGLEDGGLAAGTIVKGSQFDYTDLSDFERRVLKNIIPFYTWTRYNVPLQVRSIWMEPGKINRLLRFHEEVVQAWTGEAEDQEQALPEWLRRRGGWMTTFTTPASDPESVLGRIFGQKEDPIAAFIESPLSDLGMLFNATLNPLQMMNSDEIINNLNPIFGRLPYELATGQSYSTGRELRKDAEAPRWAIAMGLARRDEEGVWRYNEKYGQTLRNFLPPLAQGERLFAPIMGDPRQRRRWLTSVGSNLLASPAYTVDPNQQAFAIGQYAQGISDALEAGTLDYEDKRDIIYRLLDRGFAPEEITRLGLGTLEEIAVEDFNFQELDRARSLQQTEDEMSAFLETVPESVAEQFVFDRGYRGRRREAAVEAWRNRGQIDQLGALALPQVDVAFERWFRMMSVGEQQRHVFRYGFGPYRGAEAVQRWMMQGGLPNRPPGMGSADFLE